MLLNYTTKISAFKTLSEIQETLAKRKAKEILTEYENGQPIALMFRIDVRNMPLRYMLPCRWQAVQKILKEQVKESRFKTSEHALNVGWRVIKDWMEAQLALIDTGMVEIDEVFLPYQLVENKVTVYERLKETKLLGMAE